MTPKPATSQPKPESATESRPESKSEEKPSVSPAWPFPLPGSRPS
jgi:hypothetical protein